VSMIPTVSVGKNEAVSRRNFACFVFGFIFPLPRATTRVTLSSSSVLSSYLHFLNSIGSVAERSLVSARNCVTGFCFQAGMEADDFSKLAAAATTVNEGGAVAASSVSTTADELSMLKAVMLSHAQITQGLLLAQAQATQELLETLKPSLKRRSSRGKKDAAFLDTDSAFSSWEEDSDTLSLRLSGVGAPNLVAVPPSAGSGTSITGGLGGGNARVGDDAHDAAPLSSSCHLSKEEYIRMTTRCILAGLFGMTPRKLEPILRDCENLKFVMSPRARHSAMDGADLVVNYESLSAGSNVNLRTGRPKYKCYHHGSLMEFQDNWAARKQLVAGALRDGHCDHPAAHAVLLARSKGRGGG
jgi:hypothetical protein